MLKLNGISLPAFHTFKIHHTRTHSRRLQSIYGIKEIQHIREVLKHICSDTLVICDLDETLIYTKTYCGRSRWFDEEFAKISDEDIDSRNTLFQIYKDIQHHAPLAPMEDSTTTVIATISNTAYAVIGLTARDPELKAITRLQLEAMHINLPGGIIFTSGKHKGEALEKYLQSDSQIKVKRILFIDDKIKHIGDVQEVVEKLGIHFVGLHYQPKNSPLDDYCAITAEEQKQVFIKTGRLIHNEHAQQTIAPIKKMRLI